MFDKKKRPEASVANYFKKLCVKLPGHAAGCDFALADWQGRGLQGIPAEYHLHRTEDILDLLKY